MQELKIEVGDNLELLKNYPDNYFDSVVTDAPYGLGKEPDAFALLQAWIDHGFLEIRGSGFMGKTWDAFVPQPLFWKEVFRVLKPGGYLLCFFGTRTYDWGTMAIRLAGFEIRDMITWHYASGFPKSLNVSKAIDAHFGAERKVISEGKTVKRMIPGADQDKTGSWIKDNGRTYTPNVTEAATEQASEMEGWGTALKPATEPICVARKPLIGTVAETVLTFGTGGINIDACRIEFESESDKKSAVFGRGTDIMGGNYVGAKHTSGRTNIPPDDKGRFPANVIFDEFTAELLDNQSGQLSSGKLNCVKKGHNNNVFGQYAPTLAKGYGDTGGASRFFYCAKASQAERNAGCEDIDVNHITVKPIAVMRWLQKLVTPVGGITLDPFAGSGTSGCDAAFEGFKIVLMEREADYIPLIEARTSYWSEQARIEKIESEKKLRTQDLAKRQVSIFDVIENRV